MSGCNRGIAPGGSFLAGRVLGINFFFSNISVTEGGEAIAILKDILIKAPFAKQATYNIILVCFFERPPNDLRYI